MKNTILLATSFLLAASASATVLTDGTFTNTTGSGILLENLTSGSYTGVHNNAQMTTQYPDPPFAGVFTNFHYAEDTPNAQAFAFLGEIAGNTPGFASIFEENPTAGDYYLQFDYSVFEIVTGAGNFADNGLRVDIITWNDTGFPNQGANQIANDEDSFNATDQSNGTGIGNNIFNDPNTTITTLTLDSLIQSTTLDSVPSGIIPFETFTDDTTLISIPEGRDNLVIRFWATNVNARSGGTNREFVAIDNVMLVVPEPSVYASLVGLGCFLFALRSRQKRNR